MKRIQFNYHCPADLIAQEPTKDRDASRLLLFEKNRGISDHFFSELPELLSQKFALEQNHNKILLIGNNSKVYPARLKLFLSNGAKCELFLLEIQKQESYSCLLKPKSKMKQNEILYLDENGQYPVFQLIDHQNSKVCPLFAESVLEFLEKHGSTPLPPYIKRLDTNDKIRYQNIYASNSYTGSSAAPTAGFHFTDELIENLSKNNINMDYVTLHVGLGTFLPVKTENIAEHMMHEENYFISSALIKKIFAYKANNWPIIFVGTTSLRTVESFFRKLKQFDSNVHLDSALQFADQWHSTNLFLYPKHDNDLQLPIVGNAIITNFHQPESSLLMLVASLIGFNNLKMVYDHALKQKYRFFSYGDSSLLIF